MTTGQGVILFDAPESFAPHIVKAVAEVTKEPIMQPVYLKVFDQLLTCGFDALVPGHLTYLADRQDVQMSKDYALDVYKTVKRIHDGTDQMKVMSGAAQKYSWDNKFAIFRTLLDGVVAQCAAEIQGRWIDKMAGVDVFGESHCRAALIYARWDD